MVDEEEEEEEEGTTDEGNFENGIDENDRLYPPKRSKQWGRDFKKFPYWLWAEGQVLLVGRNVHFWDINARPVLGLLDDNNTSSSSSSSSSSEKFIDILTSIKEKFLTGGGAGFSNLIVGAFTN